MATYTIKSGDTFTSIAAQFHTTVEAVEAANPGVKPTALQIGQVINLPGGGGGGGSGSTNYTIKAGDTFSSIARGLNVDVGVVLGLNPGVDPARLQVGQVVKVPVAGTVQLPPSPPPSQSTTPSLSSGKYTIVSGDTFTAIAGRYGTDVATIQNLNPGVNPNNLQVGQVVNVPSATPPPPPPDVTPSTGGGVGLIHYSGPSSNFPSPQTWASYGSLWAYNSGLMRFNDTDSEIAILGAVIPQVSGETGVDARVILCMCMQETGGSVSAPITFSPDMVRNTGIMQAHNGAVFDAADPRGSILQMVRDGAGGTRSGDGLKQCLARYGGDYYEALRAYNSGSVDRTNLSNGITATGDYVSKMANRLLGRTWQNM